ncbi:hypothetical protein [Eubacterium sp. 14-2]|uniref:hypothetical protein n=1 Tax=Eubacterium sp. 14-2 TaxID=1235790 RepID=UPI001A9A105C|nr:hypothetical protein [Eubacterium sp. 14-2]
MERLTRRHADGELFRPVYVIDRRKGYVNETDIIDKLAEYEDLEEQGKLLKLPCAVGDTVYSFSFEKILTLCVDSFVIYTDGIDARLSSKMKEYEFLKIDMDIADFGEKWFSTKEAAEAALKELERGNG